MNLHCKRCGEPIPDEQTDLMHLAASCASCHAIFDISAEVASETSSGAKETSRPVQRRRPEVPLPKGITVEYVAQPASSDGIYRSAPTTPHQRLRIVHKWYQHKNLAFLIVVLFFGLPVGLSFLDPPDNPRTINLFAGVFLLALISGWTVVLYAAIATCLNRTTISVTEDHLIIKHWPLPWPGNKSVPLVELKHLYCEEFVANDGIERVPTRRYVGVYHLNAILQGGTTLHLIRRIPLPQQALYIEQTLEEALGIIDVEVPGEFSGATPTSDQ